METLSTRAMIVSCYMSAWTARKYDKKASKEVSDAHNASENVGRYNKNLLPLDSPTYKAVQQAINACRTLHYEQTLPWNDDGSRILPATNYLEYTQRMRQAFAQIDSALTDFLNDYPTLKANAQRLLNGLYNEDDYPTVAELRAKFSHDIRIMPLPDAADFRVALGDEDVSEIKSAIERDVNASVQGAMANLYERLHVAVGRMVERLSTTDAVFRDSLVLNIRELCDILPRLNMTNDANLEALRERIETDLATFEPDELRESKALRAEIARKAQAIQNDLAAFMGGGAQ